MSFEVPADAYDRFMGRYSKTLAPLFADFAGVEGEIDVLEVGCGPGALTTELVARLGPGSVTAVDPSPPFLEAVRARHPGVEVHQASAESLPFEDARFDTSLAQLVVHHMTDSVRGIAEMARVTREGGTVAACVWDIGAGFDPLSLCWRAVKRYDPGAMDETGFPGTQEGQLEELFGAAGLERVEGAGLSFDVEHTVFEDWWQPFTLGVGPAGSYVAGLPPEEQRRVAALAREELVSEPFTLSLRAWAARGVPGSAAAD